MATEIDSALRVHRVFRAASSSASLDKLVADCTVRMLEPRQVLYRRGDPADAVYLLAKGLIRVFQGLTDGTEMTVTNLPAPNLFGVLGPLAAHAGAEERGHTESTMALTPATVVALPGHSFTAYLEREPAATMALLGDVCCMFADSAHREIDVLLPVPVRLASLLLSYADAVGTPFQDGVLIKLALTQKDLASGVGVALRSVERTLREWREQGVIGQHKGWLVVPNRGRLVELCSGHHLRQVYRAKS